MHVELKEGLCDYVALSTELHPVIICPTRNTFAAKFKSAWGMQGQQGYITSRLSICPASLYPTVVICGRALCCTLLCCLLHPPHRWSEDTPRSTIAAPRPMITTVVVVLLCYWTLYRFNPATAAQGGLPFAGLEEQHGHHESGRLCLKFW